MTAIAPLGAGPVATAASAGATDGGLADLYVVFTQQQSVDLQSGEGDVAENKVLADTALQNEENELKQEEANEAGSGRGFFSSVGRFFSDVARDVTHGDLAGALTDAGTDAASAWDSPKFWNDLEQGLNVVVDVATGVATAAQAVPGAGTAIAGGAKAVECVACVGAGLAELRVTHFACAVSNARANVTQAQNDVDALHTQVQDELDDVKTTSDAQAAALDGLRGAIQTNDKASLAAATFTTRG